MPNKVIETGQHSVAKSIAEVPLVIALRALIAAVPIVGGSVSVFVESRLAANQSKRIDALFTRLHQLETQRAQGPTPSREAPFSENLLEHAVRATSKTSDEHRARIIANVLYVYEAGDSDEVLRRQLIDIAEILTPLEIALLMRTADTAQTSSFAGLPEALFRLNVSTPDIAELRTFSLKRLFSYGLVTSADSGGALTNIGRQLMRAIAE